jgi:hypothetical protein
MTLEIQVLALDRNKNRKMIGDKIQTPPEQLKIICCGRVIGNEATLKEQSIKVRW